MHTFNSGQATKIIENHHGRAWISSRNPVPIPTMPVPLIPEPTQDPPHTGNRAERRRQEREQRKRK